MKDLKVNEFYSRTQNKSDKIGSNSNNKSKHSDNNSFPSFEGRSKNRESMNTLQLIFEDLNENEETWNCTK